mmetsp:Transcript_26419/g.29426  ORF Transcript_26419/g.29426 Transcript_26419/m.29426 type:complete len:173 (-) Transcript_26419:67-585(-)
MTQPHRKQFNCVAEQINIKTFEDWYSVSSSYVSQQPKGRALMLTYGDSLAKALVIVFPEFNWQIWRFRSVPSGFWKLPWNQVTFLRAVEKKLSITEPEMWYHLPRSHILRNFGAHGLIGLLPQALHVLHPSLPSEPENFKKERMLKRQAWLRRYTERLFKAKKSTNILDTVY